MTEAVALQVDAWSSFLSQYYPQYNAKLEQHFQYLAWAERVVSALPHLPQKGLNEFKRRCEQAELQTYIEHGTERQAQNAALRIMEQKVLRAGESQEQTDKFLLKMMSDTLKPSWCWKQLKTWTSRTFFKSKDRQKIVMQTV